MNITFYICAVIAVVSTLRVITGVNAVHSLLYFIVSLLATGLVFFVLGAPFAAALVVIVNAGAIMVLFVFVIMMLNLGSHTTEQERSWLRPQMWAGPTILAAILFIELIYALVSFHSAGHDAQVVTAKDVGVALFGPYLLGVELASMLLLAGLMGAYHLGRTTGPKEGEKD